MRNCDLLQNYAMKHVKYNKVAENFRVYHFNFLDKDNSLKWKDQLMNDLLNFYKNEDLELIGAINDP